MPVIAVVSGDARLAGALDRLPLQLAVNSNPDAGLSSSIRIGLDALPTSAESVLIATADQPFLEAGQVRRLAVAFAAGRIVVSRYGERTGNPQVYDRRYFGELRRLSGDLGGRVVADQHPGDVIEIEFEPTVGDDVDTPEDWDRIRRLR